MSEGQLTTGSSLSVTTISNEHAEVFPDASVAMEVTVVVPSENTDPEGRSEITDEEQLSVESILKLTTASHEPGSVCTFIVAGQEITGGSLSATVTLNEHVEIFPAASVATEFTVVVPIGKTLPEAGTDITFEVQLSFEVTLKFTTAPQSLGSVFTKMSAGQIIAGASLSITVTLNEHVEVFPSASVATEFTFVVPTGKTLPEDGFEITVEEQLSVEDTLKLTMAPQSFASVLMFMSAGQLITGNSLSVTITLNEQVEMFPDGSVAIEFTVVVPIEKTLPEAGVEITVVEQLSVANTLNVTTALHFPGSALTYLFVQFNTGGILSVTVTLKEHVTVLPEASVAVDVTIVVPTEKNEPDDGTDTTFTEQLSVAVTLKLTTAPHVPGST